MKIAEILTQEMVIPDLAATDKVEALRELSTHMCATASGAGLSADGVFKALNERERLGSTGVGEGIAIPHAKIPKLTNLVAAFARSRAGVPFDSKIDNVPARLIFVLLVPEDSAGAHLKALARISRLLKSSFFRDRLLAAPDVTAVYQAILEEDAKY